MDAFAIQLSQNKSLSTPPTDYSTHTRTFPLSSYNFSRLTPNQQITDTFVTCLQYNYLPSKSELNF